LSLVRLDAAARNPVPERANSACAASPPGGASSSPASCQRTNWSYGMSSLSARMTKSR